MDPLSVELASSLTGIICSASSEGAASAAVDEDAADSAIVSSGGTSAAGFVSSSIMVDCSIMSGDYVWVDSPPLALLASVPVVSAKAAGAGAASSTAADRPQTITAHH